MSSRMLGKFWEAATAPSTAMTKILSRKRGTYWRISLRSETFTDFGMVCLLFRRAQSIYEPRLGLRLGRGEFAGNGGGDRLGFRKGGKRPQGRDL